MTTLIRVLVALLLSLWVGAVAFFPVVAAVSFQTLSDTHAAGTVVRLVLRALHGEGLVCGVLLVGLLAVAASTRAYGRSVQAPLVAIAVMLGLTAYSQYSIMPTMESDRLAVGGAVDAAPPQDPHRVDFNRLHVRSELVEEGVLVAGILALVLLARGPLARGPLEAAGRATGPRLGTEGPGHEVAGSGLGTAAR